MLTNFKVNKDNSEVKFVLKMNVEHESCVTKSPLETACLHIGLNEIRCAIGINLSK